MMTTAMTTVERQLASHRSKHLSSLRPNRNLATIQLFNARLLSSPHQIAMIHDQRFLLLFLGFGREDTKIPHSLQHHFISALALQERTTSDRDTLEACEKWLVPVQRVSGRRVTRNTPTREKKKASPIDIILRIRVLFAFCFAWLLHCEIYRPGKHNRMDLREWVSRRCHFFF